MSRLNELFAQDLQFLYSAHQQGAKQASASYETSSHPKLKQALRAGANQNLKQAKRLEKVFDAAHLAPHSQFNRVSQGIIDGNNAAIADTTDPTQRDLVNIQFGQIAAHYYLAKYGTARTYAHALGNKKAAVLLQKTMDETGDLDKKFTKLAHQVLHESHISKEAKYAGKRSVKYAGKSSFLSTAVKVIGLASLVVAGRTLASQGGETAPSQTDASSPQTDAPNSLTLLPHA